MKYLILVFSITVLLPAMLSAELVGSFDQPDTGYASNTVIDIIEHNGGIWFATGKGVSFSYDSGASWLSYDNSNGLISSNLSALYSIPTATGQRIWVATNHEERIAGMLMTLSDGVSYSDDNGSTWNQIIFDETGLDVPYVWGGDRMIYDITGHFDVTPDRNDDWLFFTAFAGGFLASRDGGMSWRRIYPSIGDSIQFNTVGVEPSFRNRYFSCAADTSHGDSLSVWAGTAGGFFQYIFAEPKDKPFSKYINRIAFCETCGDDDSNFVYYGGDDGITRGTKRGGPFISRFAPGDGLPGPFVTAVIDFGDKLFVGTMDPVGDGSTGLAISNDFGESFVPQVGFTEVIGANRRITDFAVIGHRLYIAAEEAGLFASPDTGIAWSHVFVDSSDTSAANCRNVVRALNAWGDTLRVGTDSGLVQLFLDPGGLIDSSRFHVFDEGDSSSTKVVRVKTQLFQGDEVIWTINRPVTDTGVAIVGRSADGGVTWDTMQVDVVSHDINFFGDTTFAVGEAGIRFSPDQSNPGIIYHVFEYRDSVAVDSLHDDTITVMEVLGDTVIIGTGNGFAISLDRGETYDIYRINKDTLAADAALHYTTSIYGITGNFIPAIGVQYIPDEFARVWVSNRPDTGGGYDGISVGVMVPVDTLRYERIWLSVYDEFAWNYTFNGDTVFAATNGGLIYTYGDTISWDTLDLTDSSGMPLVLPGAEVYAVGVIDDNLWVGTDDRTVCVSLGSFDQQTGYYVVDDRTPADEVYAFPVPFSHSRGRAVDFHFVVEQDAVVTLEIYDFAMNLVRRVVDNARYEAGIYPTVGTGRHTWDGMNGKGEPVAVGVYYIKVEYSTGEVRWGKLAVIP